MLEESDQFRMSVDSQAAVWRSRNGGESWQRITAGLPENAHVVVLREAMVADNLEPAGLYAGTDTGSAFLQPRRWRQLGSSGGFSAADPVARSRRRLIRSIAFWEQKAGAAFSTGFR